VDMSLALQTAARHVRRRGECLEFVDIGGPRRPRLREIPPRPVWLRWRRAGLETVLDITFRSETET